MTDSCTVQRDCDCNKDILIIALSTGTILILIILAIIFMAVACYCSRRCKEQSHKHEADNRALEALKDNPEGVIKWHHTVRTTTDEVEEGEGGGDADNASN